MKALPKSFLRKSACVWMIFLITALSGCSEKNLGPLSSPPPIDNSPVINNLLTPDHLIWTPYYELPPGWKINLDNPEKARSPGNQGLPAELRVFYLGDAEHNASPSSLRDNLYQQLFCQEQILEGGVNCAKGFVKISQSIAGFPVEILRYYGTWRDNQREVNEIYLNRNGQILHFTGEGDFPKILPALQLMLETIQWKLEKPSIGPAQEPEEIGL